MQTDESKSSRDNFVQMNAMEIACNFEILEFKYADVSQYFNHLFFKEFSKLYNSDPILLKCTCSDTQLFSRCVQNLPHTETLRNSMLCLDSRIVKSLLTNQFLNPGPSPIAELTDNCNWEIFEKICFERISSFVFDGLLAELVSQGGLFFKSDKSLTDIVNLARTFSDSIIEGRFADFTIYQVTEGWSLYFGKMGYDNTFILFDKFKGEFWIIAKTDYD